MGAHEHGDTYRVELPNLRHRISVCPSSSSFNPSVNLRVFAEIRCEVDSMSFIRYRIQPARLLHWPLWTAKCSFQVSVVGNRLYSHPLTRSHTSVSGSHGSPNSVLPVGSTNSLFCKVSPSVSSTCLPPCDFSLSLKRHKQW